jgi:hypothetical protein
MAAGRCGATAAGAGFTATAGFGGAAAGFAAWIGFTTAADLAGAGAWVRAATGLRALASTGRFGVAGAVFFTVAALAAAARFGAAFPALRGALALVADFTVFLDLLDALPDRAAATFAEAFDALAGFAAFDFLFAIAGASTRHGTGARALSRKETRRSSRERAGSVPENLLQGADEPR